MGKYVIVPITKNGTLQTGLVPVIDINDVATDVSVISGAAMTELSSQPGWYKYWFAGYDKEKEYAITIDGGSSLPSAERFSFAGNESFYDDITDVLLTAIPVEAAAVMTPESGPEPPIFSEFRASLPDNELIKLGRFEFYSEASDEDVCLQIVTGEQRIYANLLLTIGVVAPT